jgi:hypothetical protein
MRAAVLAKGVVFEPGDDASAGLRRGAREAFWALSKGGVN